MASDFLQRFGGGGILQAALGSREGCFFNANSPNLDVSTVVHEVRCLGLKEGEQAYVSVRDLRRREGEAFAQFGMVCNLKTLELDTTLLLRVWVDEVSGSGGYGGKAERRVVGEARIPLRSLLQHFNACLYHTWITLEPAGLQDSVASMGFAGDDGAAFTQSVQDGPRQLTQPKACVSIVRSQDVGPSGKILWTTDVPPEARAAGWGPLLRSQQQHVVLAAGLHLKCERQAAQFDPTSASQTAKPSLELQDRVRSQAEEIERLRSQLDQLTLQQGQPQGTNSIFSTQPNLAEIQRAESPPPTRKDQGRGGCGGLSITQARAPCEPSPYGQEAQAQRLRDLESRLADAEARELRASNQLKAAMVDAEQARAQNQQQRGDAQTVQLELDKISTEANGKIEAANDRIRTLRQRRDEAEQELQQMKSSTIPLLHEEKATLEAENRQLSEQKEALLRIVEDLHQTCIAAGLNTAGRQSIDNLTCTMTQELRLT